MIKRGRFTVLAGCFLCICVSVECQRNYSPNSVLSTGNWYQLSVKQSGVYKIDIPFLNSLGVSTNNLASSSVRLYGNGGNMLSESNTGIYADDLTENAVEIIDGGDGIINGSDYILFYAPGPDEWKKDSVNQRFSHIKNLYSERSFYFLTIGANGKRITTAPGFNNPNTTINTFSERYFHELDSINFLASGKEWYGEEFANAPGKTLTRDFMVTIPGLQSNSAIILNSDLIARSAGIGSRFDIKINNQPVGQLLLNAVGGGQYDLFAQEGRMISSISSVQSPLTITYSYVPGSFNSQGWLNWFEVFARRNLSLTGAGQLQFRDWASVGNNIAEFVVSNADQSTSVWDITDPLSPVKMPGTVSNNEFRFRNSCARLKEYVAFNTNNFLIPVAEGTVQNQNLHNAIAKDLIIISYPAFIEQARRLAQLHVQRNGLRTLVITPAQVYKEFAGGNPDPTAIRDFVKMYHDKYRNIPADKLKYLLLFGDASFDYRDRTANNSNYVPAYQSSASLDALATYTSDDFFGFLDDNEDINSGIIINDLDIGIGRVPARTIDEAKNFVDKVLAYMDPKSYGPWRNNVTFIADDEDQNLHFQDAEILSSTTNSVAPFLNQQKIYLDAFQQESGPGGSRYPQANQASNNQIFNGTLIWNYNGHGGARRLAEETILDQEMVNSWNNPDRLPLFITATCDFAPFDNPGINSIGENILLRPKTGAIALMTTTRVVFAFSNRIINNNYLQIALQPGVNGKYRSLGDAVRDVKNYTYQTSADIINNRKFTLLGDPALTPGFPSLKVRITNVNGLSSPQQDTLSSKETVVLVGEVTDLSGNVLNNFNGNVYSTIFDKPQIITTLGNDATSQPAPFSAQTSVLFKGKSTVTNGRFSVTFKVPKDINYQYGNGKISLYAENGNNDAGGFFTGFIVGGIGNNIISDNEGPAIRSYLNDEKFVNGGITNQTPILILKLSDSSGINTVGNGIGHDIIAVLDNDNRKFFVLNDFYEGELNSYQTGMIRFQLPELEPGEHTIKVKAWDILNNSNEVVLDFRVAKDEELTLSHVLNYPNPFTTHTQFWFEHNRPGQDITATVEIFSLTGIIIKTIRKTINSPGNRSNDLEWNGRDEYGNRVARGVYLYKLTLAAPGNQKKQKIEKLVIF